jgi:hypothetical protein
MTLPSHYLSAFFVGEHLEDQRIEERDEAGRRGRTDY